MSSDYESWASNLTVDPEVMGGAPVFPGTRVTVKRIGKLAEYASVTEICEDYPTISSKDIEYARRFVRHLDEKGIE